MLEQRHFACQLTNMKRSLFLQTSWVLVLPVAFQAATGCSPSATEKPELTRDYSFQLGLYLDAKMRLHYEDTFAESVRDGDVEAVAQLAQLRIDTVNVFNSTQLEFVRRFSSAAEKNPSLSLALDGALRDIQKCKNFAEYGITYESNDEIVMIAVGLKGAREWQKAMMLYGVLYEPRLHAWPQRFLTAKDDIPSDMQSISGGDWKGGFEDANGNIFVPGMLYLTQLAELDRTERPAEGDVIDISVPDFSNDADDIDMLAFLQSFKSLDQVPSIAPGYTQLHQAAHEGNCRSAEWLIARGLDLNSQDSDGMTPLHLAAMKGRDRAARLLIVYGAKVDLRDNKNATALHFAAHEAHEKVITLLLENGADLEARDNQGQRPLHLAAAHGREVAIQRLLEAGASVAATTDEGNSALHLAAI